jgi:hypothetical protein
MTEPTDIVVRRHVDGHAVPDHMKTDAAGGAKAAVPIRLAHTTPTTATSRRVKEPRVVRIRDDRLGRIAAREHDGSSRAACAGDASTMAATSPAHTTATAARSGRPRRSIINIRNPWSRVCHRRRTTQRLVEQEVSGLCSGHFMLHWRPPVAGRADWPRDAVSVHRHTRGPHPTVSAFAARSQQPLLMKRSS